jgi:transcriptional regulator with XRE-family HTH domain
MPKRNQTTVDTKCHQSLIELLIEARLKSGLTQKKIARAIHKSQTWIARVESGDRRVDVCELIVLSRVLGADPVKILQSVLKAIE